MKQYYSRRNVVDLDEIPQEVKDKVKLVLIKNIDEAVAIALYRKSKENKLLPKSTMINFQNTFSLVVLLNKTKGHRALPEIIFIGRSNVGKSSLINAIINRKNLAYTSKKPGFTKLLNYYNVDDTFYLVDAPGYGLQA